MGAQEAHEEVRGLIEHAVDIKGINLWIENKEELEDIPHIVGKLQGLVRLVVKNNARLHSIPGTIRNLHALVKMDLERCAIHTLPDELTTLSGLRELRVGENRITHLPDSMDHMTSLEILEMNDNCLEWFPAACRKLFTTLKVLDVRGNPLFTPRGTSYEKEIKAIETFNGKCPCGKTLPYAATKYVQFVLPTGDCVVGTDTYDAEGCRRALGTESWTPERYVGSVRLPVRRNHLPYLNFLCSPECASRLHFNQMVRHTVPAFHDIETSTRPPRGWDLA